MRYSKSEGTFCIIGDTRLGHLYNGTIYYYILSLQGDVVAILDSSGVSVAEYTYDAWGRLLSTTGSMSGTLGLHNPLRYRGYVYDQETGLYYLQSRYYNPKLCRFISADAFVSTGQGILGHNMFAYCNNNPVMGYDPSGEIAISALITLFVGIIAVAATINDIKQMATIYKNTTSSAEDGNVHIENS